MKTSPDRILTTHTGSLPRPPSLTDRHDGQAVRDAVQQSVTKQLAAGVDIINDGEMSKAGFATYVIERMSGFGGPPIPVPRWGYRIFLSTPASNGVTGHPAVGNPTCDGPVAYLDTSQVEADIANLRAASAAAATELFMSAASPGVIAMFMPNRYYPSTEDYIAALADAMKTEYGAIYRAGLLLQLDCPDLACEWARGERRTVGEFRKVWHSDSRCSTTRHVTSRVRRCGCICAGESTWARTTPISRWPTSSTWCCRPSRWRCRRGCQSPARARMAAIRRRKAARREDPDPGVVDSTTNYIEHPELVAQRICRYAGVAGRDNVIAGTDCGFGTFASQVIVEPEIAWAKLATMAEGAQLDRSYG